MRTAVRAFQKCAESSRERPIRVKFTLSAPAGTPEAATLDKWWRFGGRLRTAVPAGATTIQLPGGPPEPELGDGFVTVGASLGSQPRFRPLQVLGSEDDVLAELPLDTAEVSTGISGEGASYLLAPPGETFTIEIFHVLADGSAEMNLNAPDLPGRHPDEVLSAMRFLAHCHPPNRLRLVRETHGTGTELSLPSTSGNGRSVAVRFCRYLRRFALSNASLQPSSCSRST
jgi:hypothetical protein